jgi:HAD superfamily phosphatase (TIGR01668 family)
MDTWHMDRVLSSRPDHLVDSYREVTPEYLRALGRRALLLDVDSTLAPHGSRSPTPEVAKWIETLRSAGIQCIVVSNGGHHRMKEFCSVLDIPFIARAGKPSPSAVRKGLATIDALSSEAAFLGDQLYTDVRCARNAGVLSILTAPIPCKEPWNVNLKRWFERRALRGALTTEELQGWSRRL